MPPASSIPAKSKENRTAAPVDHLANRSSEGSSRRRGSSVGSASRDEKGEFVTSPCVLRRADWDDLMFVDPALLQPLRDLFHFAPHAQQIAAPQLADLLL